MGKKLAKVINPEEIECCSEKGWASNVGLIWSPNVYKTLSLDVTSQR